MTTRVASSSPRKPRRWRPPPRSLVPPFLLLCGFLAAEERSGGARAAAFAWRGTYAEGLEAARAASRPLLVYFPPLSRDDEPAVIARLPQLLGTPPFVQGVRVGADEILELKGRFKVKKVPAVVLLDRRENVIAGWDGGVPPSLHALLQAAVRKLERKDHEDAKVTLEGRERAKKGSLDEAYRTVRPLLESRSTSPENLRDARRIEEDLLAAARTELLRALAAEGLHPDEGIEKTLRGIRSRWSHAAIQAEVERELKRLAGTTVGAK